MANYITKSAQTVKNIFANTFSASLTIDSSASPCEW